MTDLPDNPLPTKMSPDEVIERLRAIAARIEQGAKAAVEMGLVQQPDPRILRDVEILDAVSLMLSLMLPDWPEHRAIARRKRWRT